MPSANRDRERMINPHHYSFIDIRVTRGCVRGVHGDFLNGPGLLDIKTRDTSQL